MKNYELKYTIGEEGVFRMSTVETPAVKATLVHFSEQKQAMFFADEDKRVIYSVAMRPNMLIPRSNINGEPAMVFYSEETVANLQQNFFKNNSHNGATINHDGKVREDIYAFESWIVSDPQKDKATLLGLEVKKGDWVLGQKVDNDQAWQDVKKGKLQGFSIEAYLEPVLTSNTKIEMAKAKRPESTWSKIKRILMEDEGAKEYVVGDKTYLIDNLEVGGKVTDADGTAVADATIEIDGSKFTTDADGMITNVEVLEEQEDTAPAVVEELEKEVEEQAVEINELKEEVAKLEAEKVEMSKELATAKKVAIKMSEQLQKGLKAAPVVPAKNYSEMSNKEKAKFNRGM